ncbi:MAG: SLOG family protein [Dysgonomonas sp.]
MKLAIVGSRNGFTEEFVWRVLYALMSYYGKFTIVSGGAVGVDSFAESFGKKYGLECIVYKAEWDKYGKKAGFMRNKVIVENSDAMIAFWDGNSKGTLHDIKLQEEIGRPLEIIYTTSKVISNKFLSTLSSSIS